MKFSVHAFDATSVILRPTTYVEADIPLYKGIPERRWLNNYDNRGWVVPITRTTVDYIWKTFKFGVDFTVDEQAKMLIAYEKLVFKVDEAKSAKRWKYLFDGEDTKFEYPSPVKPFMHQRVGVEAMYGSEYFGLLMEMGLGKTKCIIDELSIHALAMPDDEMMRVIVICPKALLTNWQREFNRNFPVDYCTIRCEILNKGDLKSIDQVTQLMQDDAKTKVLCVSYDSCQTLGKLLMMFKPHMLICDESHYIKNSDSKRWKAVKSLAEHAEMRRILTGTPISNNVLDVWSQFEILRPGALGYSTFQAFKRAYCKLERHGQFDKITGVRNVQELKDNMARMSFIVKKERCLDLPAKNYQIIEVDMPENLREIYSKFASEFYIMIDGNEVSTEFILVQMLKLSQICCGFVVGRELDQAAVDRGDEEVHKSATSRIPGGEAKLDQMVEDAISAVADGKLIIWSRFKADNQLIAKRLAEVGIQCGVYDGSVNERERQRIVDAFNGDDDFRVIIANAGAGGVGLTLLGTENVRTKNVFYYSNDFAYGKRLQSEDRCHRIGLRNPIQYRDYVYKDSIEQYIAAKLQSKKDLSEAVQDMSEIKEVLLRGVAE